MLDPIATPRICKEAAFLLAEADPIGAVQTLARGLALQPRGGVVSAARMFLAALIDKDHGIRPELLKLLSELPHSPLAQPETAREVSGDRGLSRAAGAASADSPAEKPVGRFAGRGRAPHSPQL